MRITESSSSRGGRYDRTAVANPTRGEVDVVRAIGMVGVLGDGVFDLVDPRLRGGVPVGDGVRVTVIYS